jgi:hypothetical protein
MGGYFWRRLIGLIFGLGVLALVAGFAYQAGTHAAVGGAVEGGRRMYGWHGFFFFPLLFFPFGFFLFFALMRMLFWGGPRHWGGGYGGYRGGPGRLEEWHRQAHEQSGNATPGTASSTAPGSTGGTGGPTSS